MKLNKIKQVLIELFYQHIFNDELGKTYSPIINNNSNKFEAKLK